MIKTRNAMINEIIHIEGSYSNDPSDSGGKTKYGITEKQARKHGYEGLMSELPLSLAKEIYGVDYWDKLGLDYIAGFSVKIAKELMDTGVNQGTVRAGEFLQRSLNVLNNRGKHWDDLIVDGAVGRKTLSAFNDFIKKRSGNGIDVMFRMLNSLQGAFYVELAERREKDERFIFGWFLNRVK